MQPTTLCKTRHGRHDKRHRILDKRGGKWPFVTTWESPMKSILVGFSCHKVGGLNVTVLLTVLEIGSPRSS